MIELFHGSTVEVSAPLVNLGREGVDFGRGFYLTSLGNQASSWAKTVAERRKHNTPVLNSYEFDIGTAKEQAGSRYKEFESYNLEWLEYVIDCRRGGFLQDNFDVVEGGVANDKVIDTVEDYEKGIITAEQALGQLAYKDVNHQIAILSQAVIDSCLTFKRSFRLQEETHA